ncbi:MAG: hypothetical protein JXR58_00565 [Bacteroidales bacterium]|nr:hypothetical protein [Bacteroidales bacterium]
MKKFILFFLAVLSLVILGLATEANTIDEKITTDNLEKTIVTSIVIK